MRQEGRHIGGQSLPCATIEFFIYVTPPCHHGIRSIKGDALAGGKCD